MSHIRPFSEAFSESSTSTNSSGQATGAACSWRNPNCTHDFFDHEARVTGSIYGYDLILVHWCLVCCTACKRELLNAPPQQTVVSRQEPALPLVNLGATRRAANLAPIDEDPVREPSTTSRPPAAQRKG